MKHPTANPRHEQTAVGEASEPAAERPAAAPDPFDVASLRLSQDFTADLAVERVLTHVPVRRPGKQDFFRVCSDEAYRLDTTALQLQEDGQWYLVPSAFRTAFAQELVAVRLYLATTRQGALFLWPCKLPAPDGRRSEWHTSALDAAQRAMDRWVRVVPDMSAGCYQVYVAVASLPEPEWTNLSFQELLRLAFRDRMIDRPDHPVLERLRGVV